MSCQISRFCSENAELSGDARKFEKPSKERISAGSLGEFDDEPAYFLNSAFNWLSFSLDYRLDGNFGQL